MKIDINDHRKVFAIQEEFNEVFPYLKLEFFSKPHKQGGASSKESIAESSKLIGDCRTIHAGGTLTVNPNMTVAELEQNFTDVYGLSVQVFRKSGNSWLETTTTDGWTLEKQNKEGEELSTSII